MRVLPHRPARPRRRLAAAAASLTAAVALFLGAGAAPAQAGGLPLPVAYSPTNGVIPALADPASSPPGANDWSCRPSSAHPYPVVLVHGTFGDMRDNWDSMAPLLYDNGYCVFALNYGGPSGNVIQGIDDIPTGAAQLSAFVDQVLAATGAAKVDIVGHSQGGMMPRYYIGFLGGAAKVHTLVGLAPSSHGTTLDGLVTLAQNTGTQGLVNSLVSAACTACVQQESGSGFVSRLDSLPDTVAGVNYTVIETEYDAVVTPYQSSFLSGSGVHDIDLQQQCALDFTGHVGIAFDPNALGDVLNALDPAHPVWVPCVWYSPGL